MRATKGEQARGRVGVDDEFVQLIGTRVGTQPVVDARAIGVGHAEDGGQFTVEVDEQRMAPEAERESGCDDRGSAATFGSPAECDHDHAPVPGGGEWIHGEVGEARVSIRATRTQPVARPSEAIVSSAEVSGHLVGSAAFKAVGTGDPRPAGSIPVHLRQRSTRSECGAAVRVTTRICGRDRVDGGTLQRSSPQDGSRWTRTGWSGRAHGNRWNVGVSPRSRCRSGSSSRGMVRRA